MVGLMLLLLLFLLDRLQWVGGSPARCQMTAGGAWECEFRRRGEKRLATVPGRGGYWVSELLYV